MQSFFRPAPARAFALALASVGVCVIAPPVLHAQTWSLDPAVAQVIVNDTFGNPPFDLQLLPTSNGQFLLTGSFDQIDGIAARAVARLNADFTHDRSFTAEIATADGLYGAVPLANGRVLLSVVQRTVKFDPLSYPQYRNSDEDKVFRLRSDGRKDPDFAPIDLKGSLWLWPLPDGRAIGQGNFTSYRGAPGRGIIRLLDDGSADRGFINNDAIVNRPAIAPGPADTLAMSYGSSVASGFLRRLRADGSADPTFAPASRIGYSSIAMQPDGSIVACNDGERPVLHWPDGSLAPTYARHPSLAAVWKLVPLSGGRVAVQASSEAGSGFTSSDGGIYVLTLDGEIERDLRQSARTDDLLGLVASLTDDRLLITRTPRPVAPTPPPAAAPVRKLAIASADGKTLTPFPIAMGRRFATSVRSFAADNAGRIIVQGSFSHIAGQPRAGLARFLSNGALDPDFSRDGSDASLLLALPDGGAIVQSGSRGYLAADGSRAFDRRILRWRPDGSTDFAYSNSLPVDVASAGWLHAAPDGRMLMRVSAPRATPNDFGASALAWLAADGRSLAPLPATFDSFGSIIVPIAETGEPSRVVNSAEASSTLSVQLLADGRLLVGGGFSRVNGTSVPHIVRLLASGAVDPTYTPEALPLASIDTSRPLPDGRAVIFGRAWINGRNQPRALRLRADGSLDRDYAIPAVASEGTLMRDGSFVTAAQRFTPDGRLDLNYDPLLWVPGSPDKNARAVLADDGSLWVGGSFSEAAGGIPRWGLARFAPVERVAITMPPQDTTVARGGDTVLRVALGTTRPAVFQWTRDGVPVAGATRPELALTDARPEVAGLYRVAVEVGGQTLTSPPATVAVVRNTSRLVNLSARSRVAPSEPQIAGFVRDGGTAPQPILLRAIGRGLPSDVGTTTLAVPVLTLRDSTRTLAEDRGGALGTAVIVRAREVGAFPLSSNSLTGGAVAGSALARDLGAGGFTATVASGDATSGVCLLEYYDAAPATAPLAARNLAIRAQTGTGVNVLTAGFVVSGNGPLRVLVRGIGPALAAFGVPGTIVDPNLRLYSTGATDAFAANFGWAGDPALAEAARRAGAFAFPAGSRDAALLGTLEPGAYTALVTSATGATGTAMIEIYVVDN